MLKCCSVFSAKVLISHLWQLKTAVFLHMYLICTVLLREMAQHRRKLQQKYRIGSRGLFSWQRSSLSVLPLTPHKLENPVAGRASMRLKRPSWNWTMPYFSSCCCIVIISSWIFWSLSWAFCIATSPLVSCKGHQTLCLRHWLRGQARVFVPGKFFRQT